MRQFILEKKKNFKLREITERMSSLQVAGVICGVLAVLLYHNTLHGDMVFDDRAAIEENYDLRPASSWSTLLRHDFWGDDLSHEKSHKSYRPLCSASFKLNYHFGELEPLGYHVVNIVLNFLVCYLYVQVCGSVFDWKLWPAFVAGLLFTVHPIHSEAVASIVGRTELLSSLFSILAFLCYTKAISKKDVGWKWLISTMIFLLCSLLSKEQGITVAALCLTFELFIVQKMDLHSIVTMIKLGLSKPQKLHSEHKMFLLRAIYMTTFVGVILVARIIIMQGGPTFGKTDNPGQRMETPYRQLYYQHLIFINSWLLINPSKLIHDWRFGIVPLVESTSDPRHLLTLLTFICLVCFGLWCVLNRNSGPRRSAFAFSILVLTFLPASNFLFLVGFVVAERVLFLPSMGFCLLVAYGAWRMKQCDKSLTKAIVYLGLSIVIVFHSTKTVARNNDWTSAYNLFTSALKINPSNGMMFSNLGHVLEQHGKSQLAEEAHRVAIETVPNYSQPFRNYGALLYKQERYEEAEMMYRKAVKILGARRVKKRSRSMETYQALSRVISQNESRLQEALDFVDMALSMQPENVESNAQKVAFLLRMNKTLEAKSAAEKAIRLNDNSVNIIYNIGVVYMENKFKVEAERYFRMVLSMDMTNGMSMLYAGKLLVERATTTEELKEGNSYLRSIVSANPNISDAQYGLGLCYLKAKRFEDAETRLRTALTLEPTHQDALYTLSYMYYVLKNYTAAIEVLTSVPNWEEHILKATINMAAVLLNCYVELNETQKLKELYKIIQKQNSKRIHGLGDLKAKIEEYMRLRLPES